MDELPRAFRGYPAGIARECCRFPVHGHGALHGDIRKTGCHMLDKREVQGPAPGLTQTGLHLYTRFPETFDTPAAHQRIRIDHPDKDPGDSCRGNGLGTGRGLAEMGAGLQRYIQISTSGTPAGLFEGMDLGMWCAGLSVPPLADGFAILHDYTSNCGIGRCSSDPFAGKLYRPRHDLLIKSAHRDRPLSKAVPFAFRAPFCSPFSKS